MMQFYDDGVVQLDRAALTLRRYHFPSGTAKVIPLDQIRGYQAESLGFLMARFKYLGQARPSPLAATGRVPAAEVDVGHPRRTGDAAETSLHAHAPQRIHRTAGRVARPPPNVNPRFRARFSHCPGAQPHSRLKPQRRSKRRVMCLV